jgi:flagellar hook-associated protein 2
MSISPLTFTGVSTFSSDLQTVLTRAVSIAQIPLKRLQNQETDLLQRRTLVGGMTQPLTDLGNAVAALGKIAANRAVSASSSDSSKVAVANAGADAAAVYRIEDITSLAQSASETSQASFLDSTSTEVSANGAMRLVVGDDHYDFSLGSNNLVALRDKINSLGAGVTASILTTSGGNYLSVSAARTGQTTLQLIDDPAGAATDVLTSNNQGSNAEFKLNGIPISRPSNQVNDIVPGLTFTILDKSETGKSVDLTLKTDNSRLSAAISDFATKYNAVVELVNQQVGPNAGLLSGDFLVREVQQDMRNLGNYQANGAVKSLAEMGVNFESTGKITFDSTKFDGLSDSQISGAFQFFGSASTGFGALAKNFNQLTDPVTGLIRLQQDSYDTTDRRLQSQISTLTERIDNTQKSVSARLQLADALLAQLESQQKSITASIQSVTYALYGKIGS